MDDIYDTYKTANIEINQFFSFQRLINNLIFLNFIIPVEYMSLSALHRISSPMSIFDPVKSFILACQRRKINLTKIDLIQIVHARQIIMFNVILRL
jgi:hypothetical protein